MADNSIKIKKQDLKDIANQVMAISMEGFDVALNDSDISREDEEYTIALFYKEKEQLQKKIKDKKYLGFYDVETMTRYAISKVSNALALALANDWEDGAERMCDDCGTVIYPYDTECGYCGAELDTRHLEQSDFYAEVED
jgi:hypothetical protein